MGYPVHILGYRYISFVINSLPVIIRKNPNNGTRFRIFRSFRIVILLGIPFGIGFALEFCVRQKNLRSEKWTN